MRPMYLLQNREILMNERSKVQIKLLLSILLLSLNLACPKSKNSENASQNTQTKTLTDGLLTPANISITLLTNSSVGLAWTDLSTEELIYEIYSCVGTDCTDFSEIATSPLRKDSVSIVITQLSQNTIYNFRIRATNSGGSSDWLSSGNVSTNPDDILAPTSLNITQKSDTSVSFSWIDNATNETQYIIEQCSNSGCSDFTAAVGSPAVSNTTNLTIDGLNPSMTYNFRIKATNTITESPFLPSGNIKMSPAKPSDFVTGLATANGISFTWVDHAIDETNFEIEKCIGSGCTNFAAVSNSPIAAQSQSYAATGLSENSTYRFRIRAISESGQSDYLYGPYISTSLAEPTSLIVGSATDSNISLSWTENSSVETGYEIQKCLGAGCSSFTPLAGSPLSPNSISFNDSGLSPSTIYKYRIRSLNGTSSSLWLNSNEISTGPLSPTTFTVGAITHNSIAFSWTDNATDEINYQIDRCTGVSCSNFSPLTTVLPPNTTGYTDNTVLASTTYSYRIKALGNNSGSAFLTSSGIATLNAPILPANCNSKNNVIVDYGNKSAGTLASSERGLYTDIKYIPSSVTITTNSSAGLPNGNIVNPSTSMGAAYIDTGAQAIKYSYWNGSVFNTEIVAGDAVANATYIQLVYLANLPNVGLPIIFWTNGASNSGQIMMAVRSTNSLTTTGTWLVQAIDAGGGVTNRALKAAVNPNDGIILSYQSSTTSSMRFIYCTSNCGNPNSYVAMASGNRLDTASLANQVRTGIGWCQQSEGIYIPAVVYGVSATTFTYGTCLTFSSTPTNCLSATNWTKSTTPITVGASSGLVSDLYLDPSILKDTPKIILKDGAAGLKTYTLPTCDSFTAASTYTGPGATIVTTTIANAANSFVKILKHTDYSNLTNEQFLLVYNDGVTDMRWAITNASNNFGGSWLSGTGASSSIQNNAALLAAAGATTMGADINPTTGQVIAGYGTSIASSFNITLGVVDGYLPPANPNNAAVNSYYQLPIESTGAIQLNASQYNNIAIASTNSNQPAMAWVDFSSGVYTTGKLKYSLRNSTGATGSWTIINVPGPAGTGTSSPLYPSLAFDNNNLPWIGYWDQTALRFVLATNSRSDGSGVWLSYMFPLTGAVNYGAPVAQPAANKTAVAMYYSGGVAYPVMIVTNNSTTTTKSIRSAKLTPSSGKWSTVANIDGALAVGGAAFLSADFDLSGKIVVAYQNLGVGAVRVKYSSSTDGIIWDTNAGVPYSVSQLNTGEGATVKINPVTGNPSVSYYDRANGKLFFATCTANCTGSGTPTFSGTSTSVLNGIGINNLSALGNANLLVASLTFSSLGDAYLLYNSGQLDTGSLKFINNIGGSMPSGLATTLVDGANGTYNTVLSAAANGGIPWGQQSIRMSNGVFATAYIAPGNWLGITTCGD